MARVPEHLGVVQYVAFGYSMSGVTTARLAVGNPRVWAVFCVGFPPTADLGAMGERARLRHAAARADALADLACPIRCWWGAKQLVLGSPTDSAELAADLSQRDIPYDVLPGLDHETAPDRLDLVLPRLTDCLVRQLAEHADGH